MQRTLASIVFTFVLTLAGAAGAQPGPGPGPGRGAGMGGGMHGGGMHGGGMGGGMRGAGMGQGAGMGVPGPRFFEEMADELGLKPEQKKQIRAIADETQKAHIKLRADIEVLEVDLRAELDRDAPDEAKVTAFIDRLGALELEARKGHILAMLKTKKLLTAEQRVKLEKLREARREIREEVRVERRMGPPVPPVPPARGK